ncbi:MFS transporter [Staphylococcus aureus]
MDFYSPHLRISFDINAFLWGRFNDKSYVKSVYIFATIACGCSAILQGLATNIEFLMAARILQGLTYSALIQSVMFVVVNACHQQLKGTFVGTTNSMLVVGQLLAVFLALPLQVILHQLLRLSLWA